MKAVTDQVLLEGVQKFAEPFDKLIEAIEAKRDAVTGRGSAAAATAR